MTAIHNYILKAISLERSIHYADDSVIDDVKSCILSKYGDESAYIKELVIDHLERERENIREEIIITDPQIEKIEKYLTSVLDEERHGLHKWFTGVINNKIFSIDPAMGDDLHTHIKAASLISQMIGYSSIINMVAIDEKNNLSKKNDRPKIESAISLLSGYSTDTQLLHYLKDVIIPQKTVSIETVKRAFFYNCMQIFNDLPFSKKDSAGMVHNILLQVFDTSEQYRITSNTKTTKYKNFILTQYSH